MGQRAITDPDFGNFTAEHQAEALVDGDKRMNFVMLHMGHRFHHLYLWHILDIHSIMSLVLTKLSPDVAMDTENVHTDTQQVQRRRRKAAEDEANERGERKKFRAMVGAALGLMSKTSKLDNMINRINTAVQDVKNLEDKITEDEGVILDLKVKHLEATVAENEPLVKIYTQHLNHHHSRVVDRNEELVGLKDTVKKLTAAYDAAVRESDDTD